MIGKTYEKHEINETSIRTMKHENGMTANPGIFHSNHSWNWHVLFIQNKLSHGTKGSIMLRYGMWIQALCVLR